MNDKPPAANFQTTALNPEARLNPYPRLKALQERCPVFYDEGVMAWMVMRSARR